MKYVIKVKTGDSIVEVVRELEPTNMEHMYIIDPIAVSTEGHPFNEVSCTFQGFKGPIRKGNIHTIIYSDKEGFSREVQVLQTIESDGRRANPRYAVDLPIYVSKTLGKMVDISFGGCKVTDIDTEAFEVNDKVSIDFSFSTGACRAFPCKVVWKSRNCMGLQFSTFCDPAYDLIVNMSLHNIV